MKKFLRRISLVPKGLRYKLIIAFSLMSVIPLLVCVYIVNVLVFPHLENLSQVSFIVLFTGFVAFLGFVLARRIVDPIIDMALETRIIAGGDFSKRLRIDTQDEIGDLGKSINLITKRIRDSMVELHDYSMKTKEVNLEIQKKVLALSNLLQIGDLIAVSEKLDTVVELVVEKVNEIEEDNFSVLFMAEANSEKMVPLAAHNVGISSFKGLSFNLGGDYIGSIVSDKKPVKVDYSAKLTPQMSEICNTFKVKNCLIIPVLVHGKGGGFILTGNNKDDYEFRDDNIELVKVLAKQLGIAIENDILLKRTQELAIKDELTGLYNEKYIKERLDEEIKRAILFQRPCSLLLFNIDNFAKYRDVKGEMVTEDILKKVAKILKQNSTEISKVARMAGDEFAVVLPERNKKEAMALAEEIRKKIGETDVTVSGSVSENPIDGTSGRELFNKAAAFMKKAKAGGKNRIEA